jgi:hypothetical protein
MHTCPYGDHSLNTIQHWDEMSFLNIFDELKKITENLNNVQLNCCMCFDNFAK